MTVIIITTLLPASTGQWVPCQGKCSITHRTEMELDSCFQRLRSRKGNWILKLHHFPFACCPHTWVSWWERLGAPLLGSSWKFQPYKLSPFFSAPSLITTKPQGSHPILLSQAICGSAGSLAWCPRNPHDVNHKPLLPSWYIYDVNSFNIWTKSGIEVPSISGSDNNTYTKTLFMVYLKFKFNWASYLLSGPPIYGPHLHVCFLSVTDGHSAFRSQSHVLSRKSQSRFPSVESWLFIWDGKLSSGA